MVLALLSVNKRWSTLIGCFSGGKATATEQSEADRKYTITNRSRVSPCAGEQEEEELQVRQQEDHCPHPYRKRWQTSTYAVGPVDDEGQSRRAGCILLHMLQTDAVNLKDVIHCQDTEQQVESHAHPSHPLTEVHHPPYCRKKTIIYEQLFKKYIYHRHLMMRAGGLGLM